MCGRFGLGEETATIAAVIDAAATPACDGWRPRSEIFPSDVAPVAIADRRGRRLGTMRWGWRRSFATGLLINATLEGLWCNARGQPALWRESFRRRRCLVPANCWYEWADDGGGKRRYRAEADDAALLCFGGVWERPAGAAEAFFSIVTRPARSDLADCHQRMPLLLDGALAEAWLDPERGAEDVLDLVQARVAQEGSGTGPPCRYRSDEVGRASAE